MESYQQYYEAFSFNPKDWIRSLMSNVDLMRQRQAKKKVDEEKAKIAFVELKRLLQSMGYTVGLTQDKHGSYHANVDGFKLIGLKPPTLKNKLQYMDDPILSIAHMRRLFVLAHEAGHAHQFDDNDERILDPDFERVMMEMLDKNPGKRKEIMKQINNLLIIWEEIDAWIKGMGFIPDEYKDKYKQYALEKYRTYLQSSGKSGELFFRTEPLIAELLRKMDYEKHALPSLKL